MELNGTGFIATIQKPDSNLAVTLKINQQVNATILSLTDNKALLSVKGVRVEAQLESPEQLASLMNAKQARFLIKDISENSIKLQLLPRSSGGNTQAAQPNVRMPVNLLDLSKALLSKYNLQTDTTNLRLVQSFLSRGMDVNPDTIKQMRTLIDQMNGWSVREMETAIQMKAAGLPLSSGTLAMMMNNTPELSKALVDLHTQLQNLLSSSTRQEQQLPAQSAQLARNALNQLENLFVQWNGSSVSIQQSIQKAVELLGRSVEQDIAGLIKGNQNNVPQELPETLMFSLAAMRSHAARQGMSELTEAIDQFTQHFRTLQFINLPSQTEPSQGQWLRMDIPLQYVPQGFAEADKTQPENYNKTRLRVAYRYGNKDGSHEVDPNYTRLVIQVDITPDESLDVDLSIANKKIGGMFTSSSDHIQTIAEDELAGLQKGLEEVGYNLETSRFLVKSHSSTPSLEEETENKMLLQEPSLFNRYDMEI